MKTLEEKIKVIAEFDGWKKSPYQNTPNKMYKNTGEKNELSKHLNSFNYHKSYDELIPVWFKFRDISFEANEQGFINYNTHHDHCSIICKSISFDPILIAFENIYSAIVWYDRIRKQP